MGRDMGIGLTGMGRDAHSISYSNRRRQVHLYEKNTHLDCVCCVVCVGSTSIVCDEKKGVLERFEPLVSLSSFRV